jgi:hypothetical protein
MIRYTEEEYLALLNRRNRAQVQAGHAAKTPLVVLVAVGDNEKRLDHYSRWHGVNGATPYRSKLEAAYASYLHTLMLAGDILTYKYEFIRLTLAPHTTITVDWFVLLPDQRIELHETKGKWFREDGWVKLKVAASLCPMWRFVLVQRKRGAWEQKELPS